MHGDFQVGLWKLVKPQKKQQKGSILGGEIIKENEESIELKFFNKDEVPELFNQQHNDAFNDFANKRTGVYR